MPISVNARLKVIRFNVLLVIGWVKPKKPLGVGNLVSLVNAGVEEATEIKGTE